MHICEGFQAMSLQNGSFRSWTSLDVVVAGVVVAAVAVVDSPTWLAAVVVAVEVQAAAVESIAEAAGLLASIRSKCSTSRFDLAIGLISHQIEGRKRQYGVFIKIPSYDMEGLDAAVFVGWMGGRLECVGLDTHIFMCVAGHVIRCTI